MRNWSLFLLWPLLAGAFAVLTAAPVSVRKYVSPDYSFEFTVPVDYKVYTGSNKESPSYIPVCHDQSVVCVLYPSDQYQGTTFGAASFEVTLLDVKTENACLTPGRVPISGAPGAPTIPEFGIDKEHPSRMLNSVRFVHGFDAAGMMSHNIEVNQYRGFKNGQCYSLTVSVTFTSFAVYDPGTIKEFTKQDIEHVTEALTRVLDSFKILH